MINLILCGGSGTRLWPLSRRFFPKHFYPLLGEDSLFQLTMQRNASLTKNRFIIVTNEDQYELALNQSSPKYETHVILEPVGRNTAPAIALACMGLKPDEVLLISPSDHLIRNIEAYEEAVKLALKYAEADQLVTFGIKPHYPETGYGYIEANGHDVVSFKEKPNLETAEVFLQAGNYYWNSGMFCFKAGVYLEELKAHAPEIYEKARIAFNNAVHKVSTHIDLKDMQAIPDLSIDYAVMEQSKRVKVVPADIGWTDLGSFDSLYEELEKDAHGNTLNPKVIALGSKNNCIISNGRTVATIGVEDLIVVETHDALLICKRGHSQDVKKVVDKLKTTQPYLVEKQQQRFYSWGTELNLWEGHDYRVKEITLKPQSQFVIEDFNGILNVVNGGVTVHLGNEIQSYSAGQSITVNNRDVELTNSNAVDTIIVVTLFR